MYDPISTSSVISLVDDLITSSASFSEQICHNPWRNSLGHRQIKKRSRYTSPFSSLTQHVPKIHVLKCICPLDGYSRGMKLYNNPTTSMSLAQSLHRGQPLGNHWHNLLLVGSHIDSPCTTCSGWTTTRKVPGKPQNPMAREFAARASGEDRRNYQISCALRKSRSGER